MEILPHVLYMFLLLRPLFHTVSYHFLRRSHPLSDQLPGHDVVTWGAVMLLVLNVITLM